MGATVPVRVRSMMRGVRRRAGDLRLLTHRRDRRAVSPIIATILLVAITVVLAAVLYVFLIPLVSHVTTPLSGNLAWGVATCYGPMAGCTNPGPNSTGCLGDVTCWVVPITTASGSAPSPSSLEIYVENQLSQTVSTSGWNFSILTSTVPPGIVSYAPGSVAGLSGPGWTATSPYTTGSPLTTVMKLWIDVGAPTSFTDQTLTLETVGVTGYSGTLTVPLPT